MSATKRPTGLALKASSIGSTTHDSLCKGIKQWKSTGDYITSGVDAVKSRFDDVCIFLDLPDEISCLFELVGYCLELATNNEEINC